MPTARIDEFTVLVRYYPADYSPGEVRSAVEQANYKIADDLSEGDGVLVQVHPKESA
jgi:hypothetical protein